MLAIFSADHRARLFRKLWLELARAQKKLGLRISNAQLDELRRHLTKIPWELVQKYEDRFHHDVVAHIYAYGDQCPLAKPILHLGATSAFVSDNADLIQIKEALNLLIKKLTRLLSSLASFAKKHAFTPCVGSTHLQSAQPTTVGKRSCLWLQDLLWDAQEFKRLFETLPFLGAKGATGTQASFLSLFDGQEQKVKRLDILLCKAFEFPGAVSIAGQTYPRKIDVRILHALSAFAAGAHKFATDLRLLSHDGELSENFGEEQVGSSAMPYKKNPILSERVCALSRFLMSLAQNPPQTLAVQWLERSLDDSANRRLCLAEGFLTADAIVSLLAEIVKHLKVYPEIAKRRLREATPLLAMEEILIQAVKKGGDRQELHEKLRRLSLKNAPIESLAKDPSFRLSEREIRSCLDPKKLIGLAPEQTLTFLKEEVLPFCKQSLRSRIL